MADRFDKAKQFVERYKSFMRKRGMEMFARRLHRLTRDNISINCEWACLSLSRRPPEFHLKLEGGTYHTKNDLRGGERTVYDWLVAHSDFYVACADREDRVFGITAENVSVYQYPRLQGNTPLSTFLPENRDEL